ncbi:MAG: hypothetical protein C4B59_04575 [Candidatus Methanogaster sp.]|uniref:Uncharacterized protein n=1 Tax=Candidatus Methanogaster sp. TaxID=3386292 RepID=A0AC61L4B4_9EURY|nr:MAG: hypothetical protein C4B59_04575 [ANME-2 cluster archaeon]
MNDQTSWMGVLLLACLLVMAGLASAGLLGGGHDMLEIQPQPAIQQKKMITTGGHGTVDVQPDEALVRLAVVTQTGDAKSASEENTKKMDAVLAALDKLGIAKEDIATSGYRVQPRYNRSGKDQRIVGFQVHNSLEVTVRDLEMVGDVLDVTLRSGANEIDGVTFTLSEGQQTAFRNKAIELAVSKAKTDAISVANASGVRIVGPLEISTTGSQLSSYRAYADYGGDPNDVEALSKAAIAPQIQPGDVTVSAYVTVVYEFE